MSDPSDRPVAGGASRPGTLSADAFRRPRTRSINGPPRGMLVVAEGPKSKKAVKSPAKTEGREISLVGTFENPWSQSDEVDAMAHNRWEPTTDDFAAVAGSSAIKVDSWKGLMQVILTRGDAESAPASIGRINIFTHANSDLIALAGRVAPGSGLGSTSVTLAVNSAISEETLDQLDSGITFSVVSKNQKLASKQFLMDDVRKRFTKDAVLVIYACHGAVDTAFVQRIADTFQVKVRAFTDVIGYFPSYDDADPRSGQAAKVTNRRRVGVGHDSRVKVNDFHDLDTNAVERTPRPLKKPGSATDDDD
jgi:hypothetical protein